MLPPFLHLFVSLPPDCGSPFHFALLSDWMQPRPAEVKLMQHKRPPSIERTHTPVLVDHNSQASKSEALYGSEQDSRASMPCPMSTNEGSSLQAVEKRQLALIVFSRYLTHSARTFPRAFTDFEHMSTRR